MRPKPISPEQREEHQASHGGWTFESVSVFQGAAAGQSQCPHERSTSQSSQGRAERAVPVRLREEVQAVLRRGDRELNGCGSTHGGRRAHCPAVALSAAAPTCTGYVSPSPRSCLSRHPSGRGGWFEGVARHTFIHDVAQARSTAFYRTHEPLRERTIVFVERSRRSRGSQA